ncbi:hypothetical protein ILUMI_04266 [Ignelater luminosus]|uniref:HMG box domain-containing protein n=1 Tax=Ignelater luminosus TaxID=2038154 RepID=A0A8K0GJR1_IGNLU|nr:hypothetical protein ILUMI_04266 [Ignelater luminosus]
MEQDNREIKKESKKKHRLESKLHRVSDQVRRTSRQQMVQDAKETENVPKKRFRVGKITRNPFFNFLREFRTLNNNLSVIAAAKAAGAIWRSMDQDQKEPYRKQAQNAPKFRRTYRHY